MCRSQIHVVHDSAAASWPAVVTRDLYAAAAGCILRHGILPGFSDQELAIRNLHDTMQSTGIYAMGL